MAVAVPLEQIAQYPRRIVCLTEETTEVLYLLGQDHRIVGVSGFTVRPPEARQKPKVSAFINAKYDKILSVEPDLVLAFSNLQADIIRELVSRGVTVFTFNQRSIQEILEMILTVARIVGVEKQGATLVERFQGELRAIAASAARFPRRPRVLFEEWKDPLIVGIRWVEELLEIAGGEPLFPELQVEHDARNRIVEPRAVVERDPEIIIGSWCGIKFNKEAVRSREGWDGIAAVRQEQIYEIKSTYILQPGPAALTEGARQLHAIIAQALGFGVPPELAPAERMDPDLRG